jgi:phage FluMu gp28-like protein
LDVRNTVPSREEVEEAKLGAAKAVPLLLLYQRAWVGDDAPVKVCVKSRRIGITWATAAEAVLLAARNQGERGSDVWYLSQAERDAKEFVRDCAAFAEAFNLGLVSLRNERIINEDKTSILATVIRFRSGYRITILPGRNPDVLRGKDGYAIFDEAALLDIDACLRAAEAFTMGINGGRVAIISTQRGEGNAFNKLVEDIRAKRPHTAGYSLHCTTLPEAVAQGFYVRRCLIRGEPYSRARERKYVESLLARVGAEQEYLCIPARDGEGYFPRDLILRAQQRGAEMKCARVPWRLPSGWEMQGTEAERRAAARAWFELKVKPYLDVLKSGVDRSLGYDFGREAGGDLSALALLDRHSASSWSVPLIIELTGVPHQQQTEILQWTVEGLPRGVGGEIHLPRMRIDKGGNGSYVAEFAAQRWGSLVERIGFGRGWYETNVPGYRASLQRDEAAMPDYWDLVADHELWVLDDSVPVLPKKRTRGAGGEQRHGDGSLAVILAWSASSAPRPSTSGAESVRPRRGGAVNRRLRSKV